MGKDTTKDKRARLIDLARGGDGIVKPTLKELDPPYIAENGIEYPFVIINPTNARNPGDYMYAYCKNREQAELILRIGELGV